MPFALHVLHEPLVSQFVIRSGHGEHADAQFLASLRSEGSASPAISSPDMIADLIWFLICSYIGSPDTDEMISFNLCLFFCMFPRR